ncbi:macro domain-containing protein [Streptomyces hoynatensis]|uniref:Appr-1-p processing protein n=1 Tax=Streptomyces hoynatensis TaxID=1141874 RepID=A0A3A9ZDT1_9ACTN|nr:macro domain-containing protein [Streptomyces hoynatensis]RKN46692.1 Appr-1-p processing protein [Streptomyces hoynatensis]
MDTDAGSSSGSSRLPSHADILRDLRELRRPGLPRLREAPPAALRWAAEHCGLCGAADDVPAGIEELLRQAVRRLGEGDDLGRAAAYSFGLVPGFRGAAAQDRRKRAAEVYGIAPETFRKAPEEKMLSQLAEAVLALCREPGAGRHQAAPHAAGAPGRPRAEPGPQRDDPAPPTSFTATVADAPVPFVLHVSPVDLLRDIDIVVSSENVYLEMSKTFMPTLSGSLRWAGGIRDAGGELVEDVLANELATWVRRHHRPGLPVRPGTVAPTSSGALASRGIRRIYHAAVAVPFGDRDGYSVAPGDIARAVRESFALARAEREEYDPPLSSICFPLMGAGRGRVPPAVSARWIGWAVHEELQRDPRWRVHMVIRNQATAAAVVDLGTPPGPPPAQPG